jgi:hypothetical protein
VTTATNVANYSKSNFVVDFRDVSLTYSTDTFQENPANDGSISTSVLVTLSGDTFATTGTLTSGGHYSPNNVPAGLTMVVIVDVAQTQATVTLTGNATAHANANDISNSNT